MELRKALRDIGIRGYRVNCKGVPGRPDIAFINKRLAIFINGCFWHRCPDCNLPIPKSNKEFWKKKFESNIDRDQRKERDLEKMGWRVLTIWECEIRENVDVPIRKIKRELDFPHIIPR